MLQELFAKLLSSNFSVTAASPNPYWGLSGGAVRQIKGLGKSTLEAQ